MRKLTIKQVTGNDLRLLLWSKTREQLPETASILLKGRMENSILLFCEDEEITKTEPEGTIILEKGNSNRSHDLNNRVTVQSMKEHLNRYGDGHLSYRFNLEMLVDPILYWDGLDLLMPFCKLEVVNKDMDANISDIVLTPFDTDSCEYA